MDPLESSTVQVAPDLVESASAFFGNLTRRVDEHPALNHDFLRRFAGETLSRDQITRYAIQHYMYSRLFSRTLAGVVANTPDEQARSLLVVNMYEEIGEPTRIRDRVHLLLLEAGLVSPEALAQAFREIADAPIAGDVVSLLVARGLVPREDMIAVVERNTKKANELTHPALFRRFLAALGLTPDRLAHERPLPETEAFIDAFQSFTQRANWLTGLGALGPGTECAVPKLYSSVLAGLRHSGFVLPEDYIFWTIHVHCDDGHGENIITALTPYIGSDENRRLIETGAIGVLDARARWFDALERHVFS